MSEQVLIQFRADKALKQEVSEIYRKLGLDLPTAFRMFMAKSKLAMGLPFEAKLKKKEISTNEAMRIFEKARNEFTNVPEMSLDEINAVIAEVRAERKARSL